MQFGWVSRLGTAFALLAIVSCGPNGGGDDPPPGDPGTLSIVPGSVTLTIEDGVAASQEYEVIYTNDNGSTRNVTADTALSLGLPSLGTFDGGTLTTSTTLAGRTIVNARWEDKTAEADLAILLSSIVIEDGAPADSKEQFDGATAGGSDPSLVYPNTGIVIPPNMNTLEFHYQPGSGNDLFELEVTGTLVQLKIYFVCDALGGGCNYEPPQSTWDMLAAAGRGEDPLFYTLRGLNSGASTFGVSGTQSVQFSRDDLVGGIYYWNAGAGAIMRYEFGRRGQTAETYLSVAQTGGTQCVGCHVLSRDGSKIGVGLDIPGPARWETYNVADRTMLWGEGGAGGIGGGSGGANFATFSPDATQILTSDGDKVWLLDAESGGNKTEVLSEATMPDWAPDGSKVVFARPDSAVPCPIPGFCSSPGISDGNIMTTTPGNWGNAQTLVAAAGANNYYPAFSPDSDWVVFNKSHLGDSFDALDAEVWVVSADGGTPIRLQAASPAPGGDSWPKWGPFVDTYKEGQIMWMTFSSRRDYGLRLQQGTEGRSQLWMVGFDPARAAAGQDGSFQAFWLPFQDIASGNHIAQWVEEVDRQDCDPGGCPSGEFCEGGTCFPQID